MIRALRLENYRSFEDYELRNLTNVNLLVGPNNCGKTSALEAVQLLVEGENPRGMVYVLGRRRESFGRTGTGSFEARHFPIRHLFHGHTITPGRCLEISSGGDDKFIRMKFVHVSPHMMATRPGWFEELDLGLLLRLSGSAFKHDLHYPVKVDNMVDWTNPAERHMRRWKPRHGISPTLFVTSESLREREMARIWNEVELQGREMEVVNSMKILHETLDSIRFLGGDETGRTRGLPSIVLGFKAGAPRLPIASFGDGTQRLLALSISLEAAKNGTLLIDEIGTGLHWSLMKDMWRLVTKTAVESSIQLFATTHSLDCILGLALLLKEQHRFRDKVAIHKIERRIGNSVSFDGEAIVSATDLGVELR